jgi:hypothetical protein
MRAWSSAGGGACDPDGDEEFGRGLGDAPMLFDWYTDGDTPSQVFDGFRLSEPSAAVERPRDIVVLAIQRDV